MQPVIRPATPEDANDAAPLLAATMMGYGIQTLGIGDEKKEISVLLHWFAEKGNRFSYENAWLATMEGQIAGLLLAFGGDQLSKLEMGLTKSILQIYSPAQILRMGWRLFVLGRSHEAEKDEFLVAHLAVVPSFRRAGIATRMLRKAEEVALTQGFSKLTLEVEIGNSPAEILYTKTGYQIVETTEFGSTAKKLQCPGYHRMVKLIA